MWTILPWLLCAALFFYAPSVLIWVGDGLLPALLRLLRRNGRIDEFAREPELP